MAGKSVNEHIDEIEQLRDVGNIAAADEKEAKLRAKGYGPVIDARYAANKKAPADEPFDWNGLGRTVAEAGGALVGGALGVPGGIPGMMVGAATGGHFGGMGWDYLGGETPPPPAQQAISAGFNSMGGPSFPGGGPVADDIVRSITKPPASVMPIEEAEEIVGVNLTPGQRGNRTAASLEAGLDSTVGGTATIERQREGLFSDIDSYLTELLTGATSRESAGSQIKEGVEGFNRQKRQKESEAFNAVDEMFARQGGTPQSRIGIDSLENLSADWKRLIEQDAEFANLVYNDPELMRAIQATDAFAQRRAQFDELVAGGMDPIQAAAEVGGPTAPTYDTIKKYRTKIGKMLEDNFVTFTGSTRMALNRLYGTLSDDLAQGAADIGGSAALHARDRANQFTAALSKRLEAIDPLFANVDNPTDIYRRLAGALEANPTMVRAAKKSMSQDEWTAFVDTYLNLATRATPGQQGASGMEFSVSTTLTKLAKLKQQSPEGYKLLVEGKEEGIEAVLRLAESLRDAERLRNQSGTARSNNVMRLFGAEAIGGPAGALGTSLMGGNPITGAAAGLLLGGMTQTVLPWMAAKALTSPTFNKAVSKIAKGRDVMPQGRELVRALVAAGADNADVAELATMLGVETSAPLMYGERPNE